MVLALFELWLRDQPRGAGRQEASGFIDGIGYWRLVWLVPGSEVVGALQFSPDPWPDEAEMRVRESSEISDIHLRYILWTMLRCLFSDTDPWRVQVGLPPWHGGENGTRDWELIAGWPMDRLLGGVLQLAVDYLAHRMNRFLPHALKQSLREDFGVPAEVLDLASNSAGEQKEEVLS